MKGGTFNREAIIRDNPPEAVATRLGLNISKVGKRIAALCPSCGKKGKFDIHPESGAFYCFVCGSGMSGGNVIDLVIAVRNCDFVAACQWLGGGQDISEEEAKRLAAQAEARKKKALAAERAALKRKGDQMRELSAGLQDLPGSAAWNYLAGRGLEPGMAALKWNIGGGPKDVRFHPGLTAGVAPPGEKWRSVGTFPALIGLYRNSQNHLVMINRTFLMEDGAGGWVKALPSGMSEAEASAWNAKQMMGAFKLSNRGLFMGRIGSPAAIDLPVIVAEGCENTLVAAASGAQADYYTAGSLGKLIGGGNGESLAFTPPAGKTVILFADNDLSPTDLHPCSIDRAERAFTSAARRLNKSGHRTRIAMPPPGLDWNDALLGKPEVPCPCAKCSPKTEKTKEAA